MMSENKTLKTGFRKPKIGSKYGIFNIIFLALATTSFIILNYLAFFLNLKNINFFAKSNSGVLGSIISQNPEIEQIIDLAKNINSGSGNIFSDKNKIENLMSLYQKNATNFSKIFPDFSQANNFLSDILKNKNEVFELAGEKKPQTYIILLMNDSEKRPAGGFYGSFIEANISSGRLSYQLHDSYWIKSLDQTGVVLDSQVKSYIPSQKINFIGGNEFGFSDIDGKNILQIYQQVFPEKNVAGVIFLNSSLIKKFLPSYEYQHIEWEFVNASIDLISGKFESEKKKIYRSDASNYISQNLSILGKQAIKNFFSLKNYIKIYLPNYQNTNQVLKKYGFSNVFDSGFLYVFDYNDSFSKIDKFVDRKIYLYSGDQLLDMSEGEKLPLFYNGKKLSGKYQLQIFYFLNIPAWYEKYISELEKKYNIKLGEREKHIMGLEYSWAYRTTIVGSGIKYNPSYDGDSFDLYGKDYYYFRPSGEGNRKYKSFLIDLEIN